MVSKGRFKKLEAHVMSTLVGRVSAEEITNVTRDIKNVLSQKEKVIVHLLHSFQGDK